MIFRVFIVVCLAHAAEHAAQLYQLYALGWSTHDARGLLGLWRPEWVHNEGLHLGYSAAMLFGLVWFAERFWRTPGGPWWLAAIVFSAGHCYEHVFLFLQAATNSVVPPYPQPVSLLQMLGLHYRPELLTVSHFGPCNCPGAPPGAEHHWTPWLFVTRRPEVHALYNTLVLVPMMVALWRTPFASRPDSGGPSTSSGPPSSSGVRSPRRPTPTLSASASAAPAI